MVFGAHKQNASAGARSQRIDKLLFGVHVACLEDVVGHLSDGGVGVIDCVHDLVVEETVDELVDAVVERC